jgi:spore germination protein YaaH
VFAFVSRAQGRELVHLRRFGRHVDVIAPNWYSLANTHVAGGDGDPQILHAARRRHVAVWPVVNARLGFHAPWLRSWRERARVARRVARVAARGRFAGMTLDIEEISPRRRSEFTDLVRRVAAALHRDGRKLGVYATRRTAARPLRSAAAYDFHGIAGAADLLLASSFNEGPPDGPPRTLTTSAGFAAVVDYARRVSPQRVAPVLAAEALRLRARRAEARRAGLRWIALNTLGREPRSFWR